MRESEREEEISAVAVLWMRAGPFLDGHAEIETALSSQGLSAATQAKADNYVGHLSEQ